MLLSVVVPVFNEEKNLEPLYVELCFALTRLQYFDTFEIIMVNDGSCDSSLLILQKLACQDKRVRVISFVRNFGHEEATFAGLQHVSGDAVVLIDSDLQDPPELILEFEKEFKNGYEVVYGQRTKRLKESVIKKWTSKIFYPVFRLLTKVDMPRDVGDFGMLSRRAVNYVIKMPERGIFIRGLIYWLGLPKKAVPFVRRERAAGTSKYNYFTLLMVALEHIISFSVTPIYNLIFVALAFFCLTSFTTVGAFICYLMNPCFKWGIFAFGSAVLWGFSLELVVFGFLGLYVARTLQEVKQRPRSIIGEYINFDDRPISGE